MAFDCGRVIGDFSVACGQAIKGGVEQYFVVINRSDIDYANSVVNSDSTTGSHSISNIALVTGATGYRIEGIGNKQIFTTGYNQNTADDQPNDFTHTATMRLFGCSEAEDAFVNGLALGADLVVVAKQKSGCYKVYGWHAGLKATEITQNSNENKGTHVITLASEGEDTEPFVPYTYFNTDEATTDADVASKFAA